MRCLAFSFVVVFGCTGATHATVFTATGKLTDEQAARWFEYQREKRATWDPQIQECLTAPAPVVPEVPEKYFLPRLQRMAKSAPRAFRECKQYVNAKHLTGKLSLALLFAPEGHTLAASVIDERTTTGNRDYNECVRTRFCYLSAWPYETMNAGELVFNTAVLR